MTKTRGPEWPFDPPYHAATPPEGRLTPIRRAEPSTQGVPVRLS